MKRYVSKKTVMARQLAVAELVDCYNGRMEGQPGDYVVVDETSKTMIMKQGKFEQQFQLEGEASGDD